MTDVRFVQDPTQCLHRMVGPVHWVGRWGEAADGMRVCRTRHGYAVVRRVWRTKQYGQLHVEPTEGHKVIKQDIPHDTVVAHIMERT